MGYDMHGHALLVAINAPLGVDAFWDKPTPHPHLRWGKWRVQYKLALLAKENIILDKLLGPEAEMVELPLEPIYQETIVGVSAQSEREREREREREMSAMHNRI